MQNKGLKFRVLFVAASLLLANPASAFDMGNMMNPSKWMGNKKDDDRYYDDYYDGPGYGYGGPGYGYGAPGYGGDPAYGYGGAPGYGGDPGYGVGGGPGYGGAPAYGGAPGTESKEAEIMRLKERLRQLESGPR